MEKSTWGWKVKYVILFLWIFLFSCKAHQAQEEQREQHNVKATMAVSSTLWGWVQLTAPLAH